MTNGIITPNQFYIQYDSGTFEDGCDTLAECKEYARENFDTLKSVWRKVDGIYQNGVRILTQSQIENEFYAEEDARAEEEDRRSDLQEYGTYWQESRRAF